MTLCLLDGPCPVCGRDPRRDEPHAPDCPPGDAGAIETGHCGWEVTGVIAQDTTPHAVEGQGDECDQAHAPRLAVGGAGSIPACAEHLRAYAEGRWPLPASPDA